MPAAMSKGNGPALQWNWRSPNRGATGRGRHRSLNVTENSWRRSLPNALQNHWLLKSWGRRERVKRPKVQGFWRVFLARFLPPGDLSTCVESEDKSGGSGGTLKGWLTNHLRISASQGTGGEDRDCARDKVERAGLPDQDRGVRVCR
jgi:hypothetical protein